MAFKRTYKNKSKYLYLKIVGINYVHNQPPTITIESTEKDTANETYSKKISRNIFRPTKEELKIDKSFSSDELSKSNMNIIKASYKWVKENIDLFRDFTDC